jgi:hypothetical protein
MPEKAFVDLQPLRNAKAAEGTGFLQKSLRVSHAKSMASHEGIDGRVRESAFAATEERRQGFRDGGNPRPTGENRERGF